MQIQPHPKHKTMTSWCLSESCQELWYYWGRQTKQDRKAAKLEGSVGVNREFTQQVDTALLLRRRASRREESPTAGWIQQHLSFYIECN